MASPIKCLLHRHEDLSLELQNPCKKLVKGIHL